MSAPLEAVLITEDLERRPSRDPDYRLENEALDTLAQGLADSPHGILQRLTEVALDLCGDDAWGSVRAESAGPGRGSEFVVHLPLAAPSVKRKESATDGAGPASPVRKRVLIADDNRDAADSLGTLFELLGAEGRVVYSGPEALDALESCRPHVVLLDIGMPGMDGLEVARRIRQRPEHQSLKLGALTGWGQEEDRRRSQMAGFDFHLVKPVDVAALKSLLTSLESE